MARDFEDHCWRDIIDDDLIEIYSTYQRDTYVGDKPVVLAIDLYNSAYRGGSIPVVGHQTETLAQIDGSMPRLTEIPSGCAFNPRCTHAFERCRQQRPEIMPAGATSAACWLYDEALGTGSDG